MKPDALSKRKNVQGRVTGHVATIGPVSVFAETPALASTGCEKALREALARLNRGSLVIVWHGHVAVIMPTLEGWKYWIDTASAPDATVECGAADQEGAENAALFHLAQNVWTPAVEDDEAFLSAPPSTSKNGLPFVVRDTLRPWIRFQRAYAKLRADGVSDTEAHRRACEISHEVQS